MKNGSFIKLFSMIYGIAVTLLFGLITIPKIIEQIIKKGSVFIVETLNTFTDWSNPMPLLLTYLMGYLIVLWKPLPGSVIIILSSVFYVLIAGVDGPPIFAIPAFLVGVLYLISWFVLKKKIHNS